MASNIGTAAVSKPSPALSFNLSSSLSPLESVTSPADDKDAPAAEPTPRKSARIANRKTSMSGSSESPPNKETSANKKTASKKSSPKGKVSSGGKTSPVASADKGKTTAAKLNAKGKATLNEQTPSKGKQNSSKAALVKSTPQQKTTARSNEATDDQSTDEGEILSVVKPLKIKLWQKPVSGVNSANFAE